MAGLDWAVAEKGMATKRQLKSDEFGAKAKQTVSETSELNFAPSSKSAEASAGDDNPRSAIFTRVYTNLAAQPMRKPVSF